MGTGRRAQLQLGVLLVAVVLISVGLLIADDVQLLGFQRESSSAASTGKSNALIAAQIDVATTEQETYPPPQTTPVTTTASASNSTPSTPPPSLSTPTPTPTPPPTPNPSPSPTPPPTPTPTPPPQNYNRTEDGDLATNFECVGWRRTGESSPDGPREPASDADCAAKITNCVSGYCLFRHNTTRAKRRAMLMHSNSLPCHQTITCDMAASLLNYGYNAVSYKHDTAFRRDENQAIERYRVMWDVAHKNKSLAMITDIHEELSFERGIIMSVHSKILGTTYVSIRSLRAMGCKLPVEIWIRRDEVQPDHPILVELSKNYGVWVREIADPRASGFYTKLHVVYYTAFDNMLMMDPDNIAVTDPTYLFDTAEYRDTGAMFWPEYWRPAATVFNIYRGALVWEVLGMDFVDMFEQESGQVMIDHRRHQKAIDVLM